jgi:hypothetical protein
MLRKKSAVGAHPAGASAAELAYLLLHDPEFRVVLREPQVEAWRRVRLKMDVIRLMSLLNEGFEGIAFRFTLSRPLRAS